MTRPARITDADAKALRRLSGINPLLKSADNSITGLQGDVGTLKTNVGTLQTNVGGLQTDVGTLNTNKLARDGAQEMTNRIRTVRAHAGASRVMAEYAMSDGDNIRLLIDTDGGIRWRNETNARDLVKVHRTGKMELPNGALGLPGDPTFSLEATTKRYVDAKTAMPAWVNPTLLNGWAHVAGHEVPSYRKTPWGMVQLRGGVGGGTTTNGTVIFNLAAGYRPVSTRQFVALQGGNAACRIVVDISGDVAIYGVTNNSMVSFEAISFDV